jgi:hypothetical protein
MQVSFQLASSISTRPGDRLGSARLRYLLSTELGEGEVQRKVAPRFNLQPSEDHHGARPRPNDVPFVVLTSRCSR